MTQVEYYLSVELLLGAYENEILPIIEPARDNI